MRERIRSCFTVHQGRVYTLCEPGSWWIEIFNLLNSASWQHKSAKDKADVLGLEEGGAPAGNDHIIPYTLKGTFLSRMIFLSTIRVGVCDPSLEGSQVDDGIYWHGLLKLNLKGPWQWHILYLVGGWTNPSEKNMSQNWIIFPQVSGWKYKKYSIWNHHLVYTLSDVPVGQGSESDSEVGCDGLSDGPQGVRPLQCCIFPVFWGEPWWKCSFSSDRPSLSTGFGFGVSGFWRRPWGLTDGTWKIECANWPFGVSEFRSNWDGHRLYMSICWSPAVNVYESNYNDCSYNLYMGFAWGVHTYTSICSIHSNLDQYYDLGTYIHDQPPKMMKQWSNKLRERAAWATDRRSIRSSFTKNHPISESVILGLRKKIPWTLKPPLTQPGQNHFFDQRKKKNIKKNFIFSCPPWMVNFVGSIFVGPKNHLQMPPGEANKWALAVLQTEPSTRPTRSPSWKSSRQKALKMWDFLGWTFSPEAGAQGKNHWVNNGESFLQLQKGLSGKMSRFFSIFFAVFFFFPGWGWVEAI